MDAVDEETGKNFMVSKSYTASLNDKANLCQDLETWRGRKFTAEEKMGFDLEKLVGAPCQLQIVHNVVDGGQVYANVQAIVPIGKGMTKMRVPSDYVRKQDREQNGNGNGHAEEQPAF